ncbi:hypothetical protein BURK2_02992 [Burkholderiales bacterium]|nr:hypothetical protein BURK2_02992 [Burkholderiales bacterium]
MPLRLGFWPLAALLVLFASALFLGSCATTHPFFDPDKAHHTARGFRNPHTEATVKELWTLLEWKIEASRAGLPKPPLRPTPTMAPDLAFVSANARAGLAMKPAITWIGHATMLAQFAGLNVLTDPVFSERASPFSFYGPKRAQPPGLALHELPRIDLVLVSHNHYDHLDEASVRVLAAQPGGPPRFVVPLGLKAWFADLGIAPVVELDWWDTYTLASPAGPVEVILTPAQHWSGRGLFDRMATLWGGFAVLAPDLHFYYSGDTGYSPDFRALRERLAPRQASGGFDIALLPVGAYEPRWFMREQHLNPEEAVTVHQEVGAKQSVGVHWGTFNLTDESLDEPPRALAEALAKKDLSERNFFVMAVGETRRLEPRQPRCGVPSTTDQTLCN